VIVLAATRRAVRQVANLALLGSAGSVMGLAILRPDLDISRDPISEYVHGPFAFVQIAVFFAVGAASIVIALALWQVGASGKGRLTAILTFVWGVGILIAGLIDVEDRVLGTDEGAIHDLVVKAAFVVLLGAAVTAVRHTPPRSRERAIAAALVLVMGGAIVLTATTEGGRWFGLTERILAATAVAWLLVVGSRLSAQADASRRQVSSS